MLGLRCPDELTAVAMSFRLHHLWLRRGWEGIGMHQEVNVGVGEGDGGEPEVK